MHRHLPRATSLAAILALSGFSAGCLRQSTMFVRVRDPSRVALRISRGADDKEVLPAGGPPRVVPLENGHYWYVFSKMPYQISAVRSSGGEMRIDCEECGAPPWPLRGVAEITLLDDEGKAAPTSAPPMVTREALILLYELALVWNPRHHHRGIDWHGNPVNTGEVTARAKLTIPWNNVVEARQRREPSRAIGTFALILGITQLIVGVGIATLPIQSNGLRFGISIPTLTVGAASIGWGIWSLRAPARETMLAPPPP
jgi:hypothetical protein